MVQERPDRRDDVVNPLTPWRSAGLIFLAGWVVVLADALGLPFPVRFHRHAAFEPAMLLLPFIALAGYLTFWIIWRWGESRRKQRSRALRERLQGAPPPQD